ncbi:MAG: hypothetical protein ACI9G1_005048 [Pirellulaceae bacterium]|jgi:hypothetical protein
MPLMGRRAEALDRLAYRAICVSAIRMSGAQELSKTELLLARAEIHVMGDIPTLLPCSSLIWAEYPQNKSVAVEAWISIDSPKKIIGRLFLNYLSLHSSARSLGLIGLIAKSSPNWPPKLGRRDENSLNLRARNHQRVGRQPTTSCLAMPDLAFHGSCRFNRVSRKQFPWVPNFTLKASSARQARRDYITPAGCRQGYVARSAAPAAT